MDTKEKTGRTPRPSGASRGTGNSTTRRTAPSAREKAAAPARKKTPRVFPDMDTKEKTGRTSRPSGTSRGTGNPTARRAAPSEKGKAAPSGERTQKKTQRVSPDVVYLPPKPFSRNRLILLLATTVAIVAALLLGVSVFFKVQRIEVSGNGKYSAWDISQASGIQEGDNLLTLSRAKAAAKIVQALPYVGSARIGIKLPNTVNIHIEETEVTYAVQDGNKAWWLVSSAGKIVDKAGEGSEVGHTKILGVLLNAPQIGQQAAALENAQGGTDDAGNTVPVTVTQAMRLQTALNIAQYLEAPDAMIGKIASVDVSDMGNITLWYESRYEVLLGDNSQLSYKIGCLKGSIKTMNESGGYQSGTLDISFITWKDQVGYTPFPEK